MVFKEGEEIPRIVLAIGLGAVFLGLFVVMYGEFAATTIGTTAIVNNTPRNDSVNLLLGAINFTAYNTSFDLAQNDTNPFFVSVDPSTIVVTNASHTFTAALSGGNFSVGNTSGSIQIIGPGPVYGGANVYWLNISTLETAGTQYNVSYSFDSGTQAKNSIDNITSAFDRIAGFWQILAVGLMAGLILTVLLVFLPIGGKSKDKRF